MMPRHPKQSASERLQRRSAFSLLELVVVVAILAAVSAVVIPRVGRSLSNLRLDAAANQVARDLEYARSTAWTQSRSVTVVFHDALGEYELSGVTQIDKPGQAYYVRLKRDNQGVDGFLSSFGGDQTVVFDAHGRPDSGGTVAVRSGAIVRLVVLDPETGKASVQ